MTQKISEQILTWISNASSKTLQRPLRGFLRCWGKSNQIIISTI